MRRLLRTALWRTPLYDLIRRWRQRRELRLWRRRPGSSATPPAGFKQALVRELAEKFSLRVLVETGTALGDMVFAARNSFAEIYSIELDRRLYERAARRFRGDDHIHIMPGDSSEVLPSVLREIEGRPALFWLDAHYMAGGVRGRLVTPVLEELRQVLDRGRRDDVILIDDARLFTGGFDYPSLDEVRRLTGGRRDRALAVEHDVIRIHRRPRARGSV